MPENEFRHYTFKEKIRKKLQFFYESPKLSLIVFGVFTLFLAGYFDIDMFGRLSWIYTGTTRYFLLGFVISFIVLYLPAKPLMYSLFMPSYNFVHKFKFNEDDEHAEVAIWRLGDSLMSDIEYNGKRLMPRRGHHGQTIYYCKDFNPQELTLERAEMDEMDDKELMIAKDKLEEYRYKANRHIMFGRYVKGRLPEIIKEIEAKVWEKLNNNAMESLDYSQYDITKDIMEEIDEELGNNVEESSDGDKKAQDILENVTISLNDSKEAEDNNE